LKKFLFLVTAAILNGGRSEQKVTTLDKDLARNLQAANQVLLLFGLIENPRWPPAGDIS
jgi:hypothetical protein